MSAANAPVQRSQLHDVTIWITRRVTDVADVVRMEDFIPLESIGKDYNFFPPRPKKDNGGPESAGDAPAVTPASPRK